MNNVIKKIINQSEARIKSVAYTDLDGTISNEKINNTFTFIKEYYYRNNRGISYNLRRFASILIDNCFFIPGRIRRSLSLKIMFYRLYRTDLINFANKVYFPLIVLPQLNKLLIKKLKKYDVVFMITACTEIPAEQIALKLNIRLICSSVFLFDKKNRISGIKSAVDICNKQEFVPKYYTSIFPFNNSVYFTDKPIEERGLVRLFKKTYLVKENEIQIWKK